MVEIAAVTDVELDGTTKLVVQFGDLDKAWFSTRPMPAV